MIPPSPQSRIDSSESDFTLQRVVVRGTRLALWFAGIVAFLITSILNEAIAAEWKPASGPLLTRWAAEVNPTNAHPEYPRPQLVRPDWLNLNGLWNYAITPNTNSRPAQFDGEILVPFPIESALSGVMRRLDEHSTLWYQRRFRIPANWAGRRVRLHFGAVDWLTRVIVNGQEIGEHRGGYDSFTFDITDQLKWTGDEELIVAVYDLTEGDQARGKQVREPEGIFYTPASGIWQTVWLEPVSNVSIDGLSLTPNLGQNALRVKVAVNSLNTSHTIELIALATNQVISSITGAPNRELVLPIPSARPWSPSDPFLYDLKVILRDGTNVVDSASSYFGMRKIALKKDGEGILRIALNDQFLFQIGALDQGYWPDGIYTAPTDEGLRFDIEFLKRAGFNLVRKHVKVEPARWYYWCDKLGLLVWQDMPSGNNTTATSRTQFEVELHRMVEGLRNHPSIVTWILFNEGWGQYDTERLTAWLKALDPSRLVNNASGWTDERVGDVVDIHSYPGPESPRPETDRAAVLGEFGGIGFGIPGHTWSTRFWGYKLVSEQERLVSECCELLDRLHVLRESFGLSAAVYTQTTDVETECNGLLTYDRAIAKIDPAVLENTLRVGNQRRYHVIVANALHGRIVWKYTTQKPPEKWIEPEFDDNEWTKGVGGFGTRGTPGNLTSTVWETTDIWLRREFNLGNEDLREARFLLHHDEDVEVYLNGVLALRLKGYVTGYKEAPIDPAALATLKTGTNVMSVHCHQSGGGQFIDVGIVTPGANRAGNRNQPNAPGQSSQ